jgi:hypothetical protein
MFEKHHTYPTAYVLDDHDDARQLAARWVIEQAQQGGGQPLIYSPTKRNVEHDPLLQALVREFPLETWQSQAWRIDWRGGPVLALWPDQKHLGLIAERHHVVALCVVASNLEEVRGWAVASGAVSLNPVTTPEPAPLAIDPVVRVALRDLGQRVNHSNQLHGSMDHADAMSWFRTLTKAGYQIDPEALHAYALVDGWPGGGADRLKELATKVAAGKSLQGWNTDRWGGKAAVERWRETARPSS